MSRIEQAFSRARSRGERALIPYITAGDPDLETTVRLGVTLAQAGADIVELGIPYSDPLADGPTIQAAGDRALRAGTTTAGVLRATQALRAQVDVPIVYLVYYNCIYRYGIARFCSEAAAAGVDGLVVPDCPPEEAEALDRAAASSGIDLIYLLAPTSTPARIRLVTERARGFIYCVSITGVTGARAALPSNLTSFVTRVRAESRVPVAVGFGVSTPEQARTVGQVADGVIVGSALVDRIARAADRDAVVAEAGRFVAELKAAVRMGAA